MEFAEIHSTLTIPLYWTFHFEDLEHFNGLSEREIKEVEQGYSEEERAALLEALAWAEVHPEFDFTSILPFLEYPSMVLHGYLTALRGQFQSRWEDSLGRSEAPWPPA